MTRFLPSWADTPVEAAYVLDETRRHVNEVEDITRDPRVDGPIAYKALCGCLLPVHDPYCWGPAFVAAYEAANKRGAA